MTGKSSIFCLNLSGLKIHKPEEDPNLVNFQQTGDDNALEIRPTFQNPCHKKAEDYSVLESSRVRPFRAGSPHFHWDLLLLLHHLLFPWPTQQPHLISLCMPGAIIFLFELVPHRFLWISASWFVFFFPSISQNIAELSPLTQSLGIGIKYLTLQDVGAWIFPFCMVKLSCLTVVILWLGWEKTKLIFMQIPTVYQTS